MIAPLIQDHIDRIPIGIWEELLIWWNALYHLYFLQRKNRWLLAIEGIIYWLVVWELQLHDYQYKWSADNNVISGIFGYADILVYGKNSASPLAQLLYVAVIWRYSSSHFGFYEIMFFLYKWIQRDLHSAYICTGMIILLKPTGLLSRPCTVQWGPSEFAETWIMKN